MNIEEFSAEMDVLLNSWDYQIKFGMSNTPVVLDEYEKSVYLTKAQEETVLELYNDFEKTEQLTEYLGPLLKENSYTDPETVKLPEDLWFRIYETAIVDDESLSCSGSTEREVDVVPVTHDMLYKTKSSPFRGANERRILSVMTAPDTVSLISKYHVKSYLVRYITKPEPIILQDLPEELSINDRKNAQTCALDTSLHRRILERAVMLALRAKSAYSSSSKE